MGSEKPLIIKAEGGGDGNIGENGGAKCGHLALPALNNDYKFTLLLFRVGY